METWNFERDGYNFNCTYDPKSDQVEVSCNEIECRPKGALRKNSTQKIIVKILAGEIIRENT